MKRLFSFGAIAAVALGIWFILPMSNQQVTPSHGGNPIVTVNLPSNFSMQAELGRAKFEENCAACHGTNAVGQEGVAPPLVHIIYEPNHHGDESFQRAVALGVRQHHWRFGNMPSIEGLDRNDVNSIIAYVRELQRENGIN